MSYYRSLLVIDDADFDWFWTLFEFLVFWKVILAALDETVYEPELPEARFVDLSAGSNLSLVIDVSCSFSAIFLKTFLAFWSLKKTFSFISLNLIFEHKVSAFTGPYCSQMNIWKLWPERALVCRFIVSLLLHYAKKSYSY